MLYAQPTTRIVRLTIADVSPVAEELQIRLGRGPVPLPQSLRAALESVVERARETPEPHWLFPGQKVGAPTHPMHLAQRLGRLGLPVAAARASAIQALAFRMPAPVLAEVLGFSANTAARASGRLKVDYAAYVARRTSDPPV